jgi:hypothetical protein
LIVRSWLDLACSRSNSRKGSWKTSCGLTQAEKRRTTVADGGRRPSSAPSSRFRRKESQPALSEEAAAAFRGRLDAVNELARTLPPGSDEETQDELGLILQLVPAVERSHDLALLNNIEIALQSLLATPPNRLLAIRLRESCQETVLRRSFIRSILPGNSASTWVVAGMGTMLFFAFIIGTLGFVLAAQGADVWHRGTFIGNQHYGWWFFFLLPMAGALGSVVSILVRIKDFSEIRVVNPPALFWTGFFKPIIGASFALFVFTAFAADLISVNDHVDGRFLYLTFAFVAGFSERFAPDLVSRLELSVTSGKALPSSTAGSNASRQGGTT